MTYDQAVEMFNAQTATQQAMGQNPIVSSTKVKRKQFSSIYEAQNEYSKTTIEKSKQFEESILQIQDSGNQSAKSLIERINNSYRPTSNGATDTEPTKVKKVGDDAVAKVHNRQDIVEDGVFLWTEHKGTGHSFISTHKNGNVTIFTYGRYDNASAAKVVGEGVLLKLENEHAHKYINHELYKVEAKVFKVLDSDPNLVEKHFNVMWEKSTNIPDSDRATPTTKIFGKVIDTYDLSGNNCTTHSVNAIKVSGSTLFDDNILGVEYSEDFMIPSSLENYMLQASRNFDMKAENVTNDMKTKFVNEDGKKAMEEAGRTEEVLGTVGDSSGLLGSSSGYSGGTVNGVFGSSYE